MLIAAPVFAQRFTAAIRGTVTDPSAAAIAGAKVTLTNENTGLTRSAPTNAAGNYSFDDLPVGSYKVEVEFAGFKSAVRTKVVINVADVRAVNFVLETGAITESVSVVADSSSIKTVGAEIAGVVTGEQVRELPLNGRNFLQLTLLQPGVTANQDLNTINKGLAGGSDISVSGGSTTSNLWLIDGADNVDHGSNRTIMVYPSVDAIEEFKIQRNNYGAEFGQAGGAQINLVTRGGTNLFHGSGYYYIRRDSLNSNNYFLEQAGQEKPALKWDDWGATFGGPIIKDKLHFFVSYEKNKDDKTTVRSGFVPTAAERAGDFSQPGLAGCAPPVPNDPLTGQPFPGNVIPANRINAAGLAFLKLYQLPNNNPSSGCNNYVSAVPTPAEWSQINARVDWSITQQHPPDGPLHPGLLGGRQHDPVGRLRDLDRRLRLGPAGQVVRGPVEPEHRVDDDEHPDLLLLGQQDHRDPHRSRRHGRRESTPCFRRPIRPASRSRAETPSRGGGVPQATEISGTSRPGSTTRTCTSSRTTSPRCSESTS